MTSYVALLRAVNVGGTGKLPMSELRRIGEACGFAKVRSFIASGNLLFDSDDSEAEVTRSVEQRVERFFGRHVPVFVRNGTEMAAVVAANAFADRPGNRVVAYFMAKASVQAQIDAVTGDEDEQLALGKRELYIAYGERMGESKLRLPADAVGTARNMNSVAKIAAMLA